jgi:hypothetical protein
MEVCLYIMLQSVVLTKLCGYCLIREVSQSHHPSLESWNPYLFSEACSTSLTYLEMVMVAVQLIPWL